MLAIATTACLFRPQRISPFQRGDRRRATNRFFHAYGGAMAYRNSQKFLVDRDIQPDNDQTPPDLIDNLPGRTINTG
jgi:hypothetical protein